jgi:hypothetical protein
MGVIRDPIDFAATIIIDLSADKGHEVTGESIAEGLAICHLEPGSQMYQAMWGANFENTRAKIVELLESSGRSAMIGAKLREPRSNRPLQAGDRIRLEFAIRSKGVVFPEGATGVILNLSDPYSAQVKELADRDQHPVMFDRDADRAVAVDSGYLVRD